jgi:hypothetical protein
VERYTLQLQAYAYAIAEAVGEPVARAVLLFTGARGSVARPVSLALSLTGPATLGPGVR